MNLCCSNGVDYRGCSVVARLVVLLVRVAAVAGRNQCLLQRAENGAVVAEPGQREEAPMPGRSQGREGGGDGGVIARVDVRGGEDRGGGDGPENGAARDGEICGAPRGDLRDAEQEARHGVHVDEERGAGRRPEAV